MYKSSLLSPVKEILFAHLNAFRSQYRIQNWDMEIEVWQRILSQKLWASESLPLSLHRLRLSTLEGFRIGSFKSLDCQSNTLLQISKCFLVVFESHHIDLSDQGKSIADCIGGILDLEMVAFLVLGEHLWSLSLGWCCLSRIFRRLWGCGTELSSLRWKQAPWYHKEMAFYRWCYGRLMNGGPSALRTLRIDCSHLLSLEAYASLYIHLLSSWGSRSPPRSQTHNHSRSSSHSEGWSFISLWDWPNGRSRCLPLNLAPFKIRIVLL